VTDALRHIVARALREDLGDGDLTTAAVVPSGARARAWIEQRAPGVLSGLDAAREVFAQTGPELSFEALAAEGAWGEPGDVAVIEGDAAAILAGERVALNLLGRLSGVATLTAAYVRAVDGTGARILDTRKTTPGLRALEKQAVAHGGGVSHRAGLYDAILVKENHALLAGGVGEAARLAVANSTGAAFVEVEGTITELGLGPLQTALDGDSLILRLYEPNGARGPVTLRLRLRFRQPVSSVEPVNLLEEPVAESAIELDDHGSLVAFDVRPFEVVTLRLRGAV